MAFADSQLSADTTIYYGESPAKIRLVGTVVKGDAVGYSGGWKRALATTGSVVQMRCTAGEDGVSGQEIVAFFGVCIVGGRFSGATVDGSMYVAEGTSNGKYTQTAPSTSGDATTVIGKAISETVARLSPQVNHHSTAA